MKQFAILLVSLLLCVPCFGQEFFSSDGDCYKDPITGKQVCPLKKTAAAVGKTVVAVGNAITPNSVPLPMQASQVYSIPAPVSYPVQSLPVQSPAPVVYPVQTYSAPAQSSYGWSKSWHSVHGQPGRNLVRRIFGR